MLAIEPQDCRTATEGAPEPFVLLGVAVAVRGRCLGQADVSCFHVQGMMGASPPRFELRLWLPDGCTERARRGRACASTAVATHHGTLWTRSQVSLVCLRTPAEARSTWTFHVLVFAVAVRFPCEPADGLHPCVQGS
jgi:hypothetical protein